MRRRILLADDVGDAAATLAVLLELDGHEVVVATDGDSALRTFETFRPDAAILDITMPRLSGHEVAQRIREISSAAGTLLIALSGWARDQDREASLKAGFDHHLSKPMEYEAIAALLRERFGR